MSESTIDMDRCMQGIDCEVITWTKCSERMPPNNPNVTVIVRRHDAIEFYFKQSANILRSLDDGSKW